MKIKLSTFYKIELWIPCNKRGRMSITIMDTDLWNLLNDFVSDVCRDRDESHGHNHMETVANSSLTILQEIDHNFDKDRIKMLVTVVAWLHDVNDHKYDHDGTLSDKVNIFLQTNFPNDSTLIKNIIDRISFSKENRVLVKGGSLDWDQVLGEEGCLVRDIVSDADKLEAIGKVGFDRCVEYTKETYLTKHGQEIPEELLVKNVIQHSNEKLLRLKDEFIRTKPGRKLAKPLHVELVQCLETLKN